MMDDCDIDESRLLPVLKKINLMELFPKIKNVEKENFKMTPSEFIKEMSYTTEERHKSLVQYCETKPILENNHPHYLRILPNILIFQKYKARSTNMTTLQIRNVGKNLLALKMHCPTSLYFTASPSGSQCLKLAPGLSAEYKIIFMPKEVKDYNHHLVFKCKEDKFYVPIIALEPRGLLDIPDQIILNPAPVKLSIEKCLVIRNIGSVPACFTFTTHRPFKITPTKGFLNVHDTMIVNISFESFSVGETTGQLYLILETGEKLTINLQAAAENVSIRLEKNLLVHEDTFLGLKRCKSIRLFNNSSCIAKYSWKKYQTREEDLKIIKCLKPKFEEMAETVIHQGTELSYFGLCTFENHKHSCERLLKDELQLLEKEEFLFNHESFTIMPEKGEVWPKGIVEFIVSFEPKHCTTILTEAYLEVTGRENRLPLQIKGLGMGPKIALNPQTLDTDYIYLCSQHKYEVIATNKGDISGNIEYKTEASIFGGKIAVEPRSRYLNPGECGVFIVSFTSNKQGEFIEQLSFIILESGEMVSIVLTGKIVSPMLHFDRRGIDFGVIPFGFPTVREVTVNNLSVVPVTFSLRVSNDGRVNSLSYKRFSSVSVKPPLPTNPKEFHIDPQESVVEPFSSKKVTITLTANRAGRFFTNLEMDMWDSEGSSVSCPIRFVSVIPTILSEPDSITIPFCFINFPYTRSIQLRNSSKVAGFFYLVPLDINESSEVTCSASIPQGVIEPSASLKIDITLVTSALGRQVIPINLLVFGHESYREVCSISCVGQGPVVTVYPSSLHWGETSLLEETKKTLIVANESPIPATVSASLGKANSPWHFSLSNFALAPSENIALDINLFLCDRGKFKDTLKLCIHNGKVLNVHLSATGVGSSLYIKPKIYPSFDLGTLFSHKNYVIEIMVENKGSKPYGLVWSPFQDYTQFVSMKLSNPSNLIFRFEPTKMDLLPGEYKTLSLIVQSTNTGYFHQMFYCFASIGVPSKELHFTTDVFGDFVEPLISFDKYELRYWCNIGFDGTDKKLEDEVEVSNMSVLPLHIHFSVRHPFRIQTLTNGNLHNTEILLKGNSREKLSVRFVPEIKPDPVSRTYNGSLSVSFREHSKKFSLALHGEVNYPTLLLTPKNINFDFVPVATNVYREITLVNISPLTVYFQITWNAISAKVTSMDKQPEPLKFDNSDEIENKTQASKFENNDNSTDEITAGSFQLSKHDFETPQLNSSKIIHVSELKMPKIEIPRTEIKKFLFPSAKKYYDCEAELMNTFRIAKSSNAENFEYESLHSKICDITPFFGKLEKFSSQTLSVRFCSETEVNLHLEALINVKSGPTEIVTIDAIASEINFFIDNCELDFGKQLFCKPSNQTLKIRNKGNMPFPYEVVIKKELEMMNSNFAEEKGVLTVTPSNGFISSFSSAELNISYLPKIPGSFVHKFRLHIAYLDPIIITLRGYGVFPQVYLSLPRTDMLRMPLEICYMAIASITTNWISKEYSVSRVNEFRYVKPYRSQESNLDGLSLSAFEETTSYLDDWEFINHQEYMPTDIDIQLAIERALAINLMSNNLDNPTTFAVYARSIPQFTVPAYETDFGTVIIGRCVEQTLTVTNFGPLSVIFYVRCGTQLKEDGIQVRLKNRNELPVGVNLSFTISFCPPKKKFRKQLEIIESLFYFEIYHGPKIPIKVLASVTYPYIIASSTILNYFDVICGCCKVMNLKLKNPGLVPAPWSLVYACNTEKFLNEDYKDGRSVFHLNYKTGLLQPQEYCNIQISFKPDFEGNFLATLWIQVPECLEELKIILLGQGIEQKLNLSENILRFGPTPPYPNNLHKYFTIENPCAFPIEFYFPAFDEQIFEEDKIIRAVCTYYQCQEILLPIRKPGQGLPIELVNFYQMLLEDLNAKLIEQEREKTEGFEENISEVFFNEDDPIVTASQISFEKKKKKPKKSFTRSKTSMESTRVLNAEAESRKDGSISSILQKKTSEEIEELLLGHIKQIANTDLDCDPIQAALKSNLPSPTIEYKQGTLIIFYGAPYTNFIQLANRAALFTGFPALSIDKIVLEEAAFARCEPGLLARELIEEAYWNHVEVKPQNDFSNIKLDELNDYGPDFASYYEELERKFEALIFMRESLIANKNKQGLKTSSAKSEGSKKDKPSTPALKPMNINAPIANITEELVFEILKYRIPIEVCQGMILESLHSVFISSHIKALNFVLRAAGNIRDILAVILWNNFLNYNRHIIETQVEQDCIKSCLRDQMFKLLEEEEEENIMQSLEFGPGEKEEFAKIRDLFIEQRHAFHHSFEKRKNEFYEVLGKNMAFLNMKSVPSASKLASERKKEAVKTNKQSDGGRAGSEDKTGKNKKDPIESEFMIFEAELAEIKLLVENWDQRIGAPIIETPPQDASKSKKGQTPRKSTEFNSQLLISKTNTARGIHIWLVDLSRPEKNPFEGVCCCLRALFQDRYVFQESDYWPTNTVESMIFSVVSYPPVRERPSYSEAFTLTYSEPMISCEEIGEIDDTTLLSSSIKLNRSTSQISFKGKRKGCATAKRRREDSRTSIEARKNSSLRKLSSKSRSVSESFKSRWVLQPGESQTWCLSYFPSRQGEIKQEYFINIVNCQRSHSICCIGICDIPALNMTPEVIYPTVLTTTSIPKPNFPAYFYSGDFFDFGSIPFVQQTDPTKKTERKAEFRLVNKSKLPLHLNIMSSSELSMDDLPGILPHIKFEPDRVFLQPEESRILYVSVSPYRYGQEMEVLLLLIKDNPKIELLKIKFEGVKANVTVEPKSVNFDRILLRRVGRREIVFTNNNMTPLYVSLCDLETLPSQFTFSSTSKWVAHSEMFKVEICYEATEIQHIIEHPLLVQVFDETSDKYPVQEFQIALTVEAYDVALDVIFSDKDSDHIDFGSIRMRTDTASLFHLKNSGKYPINYKIALDDDFLSSYENDHLNVSPLEGLMQPGKLIPITVVINANTELSWKRVELLRIILLEPNNANELIAKIPIAVSVKSYFSRYEISPFPEFNFGHIKVASTELGYLKLENRGHFPLSYLLEPLLEAPQKSQEITKKGSKPTASSKEKDDKMKKTLLSLIIGPFEISPSNGIVETGEAVTIAVKCRPLSIKSYEEKVVLTTFESPSSLQNKNEMIFRVDSCLPSIDFESFKILFREHFIAKSEEDFVCPPKMFDSYTLFTENDFLFSFKNVCLYKTKEARIHVPNSGLIDCRIKVKVISNAESLMNVSQGSRIDLNKQASCFSISPSELVIEPYNSGVLTLSFRPEAIEEYRGWLNLNLEMPEKFEDISYRIALFGNGVLPQIEIVEPQTKSLEGPTLVNFVPTAPQRTSSCNIAFSNVGLLACKTVLELYNNKEGVFSLIPKSTTVKMLPAWETTKLIDHTVVVSTMPGETAQFTVQFTPKEVKTYLSQIKLFLVDNPFENLHYKLKGHGYFEEVTIENIRRLLPFLGVETDLKEHDESSPYTMPGQFALNLGDCCVKKETKILLRLRNKTHKDYFKFKWEETPNFTMCPSTGHLYPNTYKEVLIKFYPEEPVELDEAPLVCVLNKIFFDHPPAGPAWDTRMVQPLNPNLKSSYSYEPSSRKESNLQIDQKQIAKEIEDEPPCETIPDTTRLLFVNVSATADYARLCCETTNIIFKNTYMFQSRIYPLVLQNTGNVTLDYKINMSSVTVWPLKESKMKQSEQNFSPRNQQQNRLRPRSWVNSNERNDKRGFESERRCRPRPFTSGSLLDLNQNQALAFKEDNTIGLQDEPNLVTYNPFFLENSKGQIPPREKSTCNIIFSPMDVNQYKITLTIQVPNLHPECKISKIQLTASSLMPYCHFIIPESDYLRSGRRDCSRHGPIGWPPGLPLSQDTKTIEIKVLGIGHTTPIKFHVINPTEEDYTYSWTNVTQVQPDIVQSFHCSTLDGRIQAGRQQQMIFSFVSQRIGLIESFWKFDIIEHQVETLFLFLGDVRKPSIHFLTNHVSLRPTFVGASTAETITLVNNESSAFEFKFLSDSLYSEGRQNVLDVQPKYGKILANSEFGIRINYLGKNEGKVLFFLKCKIKGIPEPFTIAVEATTYIVQPLIMFEDFMKIKHHADSECENLIDFGSELIPNCPQTITFFFTSTSKSPLYYEWIYDEKMLESKFCKIKFSTKNGYVPSLSKGTCDFTIEFSKKTYLKNFPIKLKIRRGPIFNFLITASANIPSIEFSSLAFDFGYCFLQERDICYYEKNMTIRNRDNKEIALEANLPECSAFSFCLQNPTISAGEETKVLLRFHPKEKISYSETLEFIINGLHRKLVNLKGHGTEFKVTLQNPENAAISMGTVKVGKTCNKKFCIINKSLAPANLLVGFSDQLPVSGNYLANPEKYDVDVLKNHRLTGILTLEPSKVFTVNPQQGFTITIVYTPKNVCQNFSETVCLQFQDRADPLCVVTTCCIGPNIFLDRNFINFGAVVQDCSNTMKVKMINSGSLGVRFQWVIDMLEKEFSIFPSSGYCSPESEVTIQITFHPIEIENCIKCKVECMLNLSATETYPSLFLTMTGSCISLPQPKSIVSFECLVRESDVKSVEIENWSGNEWQLFPVFSGDFFNGDDAIVVPPLKKAIYDISYCPLLMTQAGTFHEGRLFFRLPNGQGLLFGLKGISLPPKPEEIIAREIPCKIKYIELLKIKNWLQYTQRLKVEIKSIGGENQDPSLWTCTGAKNLDLPPLGEKEYNLNFFAFKPGNLKFNVFFMNNLTKEYKWFDITFNVVMCGPLEIITMKCGVRQTCHHEIKLENPLEKPVQFKLSVSNPEIHFDESTYNVEAGDTAYAKLYFTPIHEREQTEELIVECPEMGIFPRELRLLAVGALPEPSIKFETSLGSCQTQIITLRNLSHLNAILKCKTDVEDFAVKELEHASPKQEVQIKVFYEPSEIGTVFGNLFVESEEAGNFTFPLVGTCTAPLAKGPFTLKPGSGINITFKNVFKKAKDFYMYVDNPAFILKTSQENILPKAEISIYVGLQKEKHLEKLTDLKENKIDPRFPFMGQLIIECYNPYVKWRFYLKGMAN